MMPGTNRPFFANFFSAFRARTSPTFSAKTTSTYDVVSSNSLIASPHVSTTHTNVTAGGSRAIATRASDASPVSPQTLQGQSQSKAGSSTSPAAPLPFSAASNSSHHRYATPLSRSPGTSSPVSHSHSNASHNPASLSISPPATSRGRQRRGSDSSNSSGGFMDAIGPEKWYIGGRNAAGEETFYKLGLVTGGTGRRVRSLDRLSL